MRKILIILILICAIAGCKKEEEPTKGPTLEPTTEEITEPTTNEKHECSFSSEWTSDDESHWHLCSCGEKTEVISHTWNEGTVQVEATEDMEGLMIYSCTVCNQNKEVVIPKLEHTHNYGSKWGSDSSTHWHLCACGSKEDIAVHTWDAGQVSVEPTEEATGLKIYTCTICDEEREIALPKLPHSHKYSSEWKYDETGHWHECSCEVKSLITPHKWDDGEVKLEATEESTGIKLYTCIECGKTKEIEISKLPHTHKPSSEWVTDETGHWHVCSCGEKLDVAIHSGGEATERGQAVCTVCNTPYGDLLPLTHLDTPVLSLDEETGEVVWEEVYGATHYNYIINGYNVGTTLELSMILDNKTNICVQAATSYLVSEYSLPVTYYNLKSTILEEKEVYVYFHDTNLSPVLVKTGETVIRPTNIVKDKYEFDDFYKDPFYQEKFDFNEPIEGKTVIYAKWIPTDIINDTYYWVKGDPKMTASVMYGPSSSGWYYIPLSVNAGQKNFKEYYVTVSVSGASTSNPCEFIVMDGFDSEEGRTYWKKGEEDFTIKSDGIYNIYFSAEHQYAKDIHISVAGASNASANNTNTIIDQNLPTPYITVDYESNIATWSSVANVTKYEVIINNGEVVETTTNSISLSKNSYITVCAISSSGASNWSSPKANLDYTYNDKEVSEYIYVYFEGLESIKVAKDTEIIKPEDPVKDGYTFGGWYYDINNTSSVTFPISLSKNTVLYAKWILDEDYETKEFYHLVTADGTKVVGLVWNLDNYTFDEYESGEVRLTANTTYYIQKVGTEEKWGPYTVNVSGTCKIYFSEDNYWDLGQSTQKNIYISYRIYFSNNKNWDGDIYAYIWNSKTEDRKTDWPGVKMTWVETNKYGENIYSIDIDITQYDSVIFTNGSKQTVDVSLANVSSGTGYYISGGNDKYTVSTYKHE